MRDVLIIDGGLFNGQLVRDWRWLWFCEWNETQSTLNIQLIWFVTSECMYLFNIFASSFFLLEVFWYCWNYLQTSRDPVFSRMHNRHETFCKYIHSEVSLMPFLLPLRNNPPRKNFLWRSFQLSNKPAKLNGLVCFQSSSLNILLYKSRVKTI